MRRRVRKLSRLLSVLVVLVAATIALLPGSAFATGEVGWLPWGEGHWTYCDYYPDSPAYRGDHYLGDYWCYMPENADKYVGGWPPGWKPVDPSWQSGTGFSPGEFPD